MLLHPVIEKLKQLRLHAMAKVLQEQWQLELDELTFEERLALLVDIELTVRDDKRLQARLRKAKLKHQANMSDIDYTAPRGLDKNMLATLAHCKWICAHQPILIVGPTGTGKTFLACALAHQALIAGHNALYYRLSRLLAELELAKGDGRYKKMMADLAKTDVLILDDFGLTDFTEIHQRNLLEIIDDRHERKATIITSQLPIKHWHDAIGNSTLADAILDRLIHAAYRLEMKGESMRKTKFRLTTTGS